MDERDGQRTMAAMTTPARAGDQNWMLDTFTSEDLADLTSRFAATYDTVEEENRLHMLAELSRRSGLAVTGVRAHDAGVTVTLSDGTGLRLEGCSGFSALRICTDAERLVEGSVSRDGIRLGFAGADSLVVVLPASISIHAHARS